MTWNTYESLLWHDIERTGQVIETHYERHRYMEPWVDREETLAFTGLTVAGRGDLGWDGPRVDLVDLVVFEPSGFTNLVVFRT